MRAAVIVKRQTSAYRRPHSSLVIDLLVFDAAPDPLSRQRLFQGLDAESGLYRDRHAVRQHPAAGHIDHLRQLDKTAPHRNVRYVHPQTWFRRSTWFCEDLFLSESVFRLLPGFQRHSRPRLRAIRVSQRSRLSLTHAAKHLLIRPRSTLCRSPRRCKSTGCLYG